MRPRKKMPFSREFMLMFLSNIFQILPVQNHLKPSPWFKITTIPKAQ